MSEISAELQAADDVFDRLGLERIDLLKVNIEGGEYELLPFLIRSGWIKKIVDLQVQFHTIGAEYVSAREAIRSALSKTHVESWCYWFVWESWTIQRKIAAERAGSTLGKLGN